VRFFAALMSTPASRNGHWPAGRRRIPFVPAKAGTQNHGLRPLDSRLRGNERDYALASNNTSSFPRRVFCARVLHRCFTDPESRGGRSAERRSGACEALVGRAVSRHARRLARRLASHDAGRSPLGAPPWRFWASGPRFRLLRRPPSYNGGHLPSGSVQRARRSQVVVPGGRGPGPPEANGYKPPPQDATPRSAFRMSPETPLNEQGWEAM